MRKITSLFALLLLFVVSAMGRTTVTVIDKSQDATTYGALSGTTFTTNATSGMADVTVAGISTTTAKTFAYGACLGFTSVSSGTVTMTAPDGYVILGYEFTGRLNTYSAVFTITPSAGGEAKNLTTGGVTVSAAGLDEQTASFTYSCSSTNSWYIPSLVITIGTAAEAALYQQQIAAYNTVQGWITKIQEAEGLVTDASKYTSNAKESTEGSYGALLDKDYATYFHSAYNNAPAEDHYLQAELNDAVDAFYFYFKKRSQNNNNRPTSITIYGSNDGTSFTEVTTINSGLPTESSVIDYASNKINLGASYKYIRFTVTATNTGAKANSHVFFTFSEFYLLPSNNHVNDAMAFYLSGKNVLDYTTADIDNVNNLDLEIRSATLAPAKANAIAAYAIPDGKAGKQGYPTQAAYDNFVNAINAITINDDFDAKKDEAVAALLASAKLASGLYQVRNYQTGHYLYQDEADAVVTYANTAVATGNHGYWRVTDNGNGTYAILDLYGHQLTKGNQGQQWSGVQGGNRTQVTTITRDYTNTNYKNDGDLASFYLGGAHINTTYNTGSKVFVTDWTPGGLTSNANHWFFVPVDVTGLTEYTITVSGAPQDLTMGDGTVLGNGTFTVYLSGVDQIVTPDIAGYSLDKSVSGSTVTVTYTVVDYQTPIQNYLTAERMENIANAGHVGYMQNTGTDFTNLMNLMIAFNDPTHVYTEADYNNLVTYYEACAANPKLPEGGKFYLVKNVSNGKYISADDTNRGSVNAKAENPSVATVVKAVERNGHVYLGVQGKEFSWAYSGSYAALMEDNGKYAHFAVSTPGQIAFAHALGDGVGDYSGYLAHSYYTVNSSNVVVGGQATDAAAQWTFQEVTTVNVEMHDGEDGYSYATFYAPFDATFDGATAYTITKGDPIDGVGSAATTTVVSGTVPAGTPVVLIADGVVTSCVANIVGSGAAALGDNNILSGHYFAGTVSDGSLVFGKGNYGPGFYRYSDYSTVLGANRAFIAPENASNIRALVFVDPTTGISSTLLNTENGNAYDLQGRRVQNTQKGLYIINGKKVIVQ